MATATDVACNFLNIAFNRADPGRAFRECVSDSYVQHNPLAPDGAAASQEFLSAWVRQLPAPSLTIHRTIESGDFVAVHSHLKVDDNDRGTALIDIFLLDGGRIVEHWDVAQPVPEKMAHQNGMF